MLINDSVTVAAEVPVLLDEDDIRHYQNELGFEVPEELLGSRQTVTVSPPVSFSGIVKRQENTSPSNDTDTGCETETAQPHPPTITGHIDLLQIRNGAIHIMDYKPSAKKVKPVDQLTLYALALSRLTGLRLFHMKCAWFDEEDYFEFFPLHVVYPVKKRGVSNGVYKKKKKKTKRQK